MQRFSRGALCALVVVMLVSLAERCAQAQMRCVGCVPQESPRFAVVPNLSLGFQRHTVSHTAEVPLKIGIAAEYALASNGSWLQESVPVGVAFQAESSSERHAVLAGPRLAWRTQMDQAAFELYGEFLAGHATRVDSSGSSGSGSGGNGVGSSDGSMTEFVVGTELPAGRLLHMRVEYSYGAAHGGARAKPQGLTLGVSWILR